MVTSSMRVASNRTTALPRGRGGPSEAPLRQPRLQATAGGTLEQDRLKISGWLPVSVGPTLSEWF